MKKIGSNQELFEYFDKHKLWILDSSVMELKVLRVGYYINVEILFKLKRSQKLLKLKFERVEEYNFNCAQYSFLQEVAFCKFFIEGDIVYLSLDPYDEEVVIDQRDNDCVKAPIVNAFINE